jgi:hypothetical protein
MYWTSGVAIVPDRTQGDVVQGIAGKGVERELALYNITHTRM